MEIHAFFCYNKVGGSMHKISKFLFSRVVINGILIILQAFLLFFLFAYLSTASLFVYILLMLIGALISMALLNDNLNPSFKIPWLLLLIVFPILGVFLYLLNGKIWIRKKYRKERFEIENYEYQKSKSLEEIKVQDKSIYGQAKYIYDNINSPIYKNTEGTYYSVGEDMFADMIKDLKSAKKFIFLEYFIIQKGKMWDTILEILLDKKEEGVDVRVIYDDIGCISKLPNNYYKELDKMGIPCISFNRFKPILSIIYNNRDHRKIMVVDGKIAYTGGLNLADEYINRISRFGVWKDTAIRVTGEAVRSFVLLFLENWNATDRFPVSYKPFLNSIESVKSSSFILPFGDNPLDSYAVGEFSYMHMLQTAQKYVHIITPYLIIDYHMLETLCNTARSGIDVKIIMPGIPDKKMIYLIGRTYYKALLEAGVKIYEYTPGFPHAKMFLSDDAQAIIGTINLDFRSLYLHFENGVYLYQDKEILEMEKDYQKTLLDCRQVTLASLKKFPVWKTILGKILRVFAPLL